ncbi:MAG: DUF4169 domain-containing protein [Rhodobacterales bacterium]|nr:MAG: DUF4169 domain-containing protein [Rhodobacterales bacterium]
MGQVINLNKRRKERERSAKRARADANAAKHGRSKAERQLEEARTRKDTHDLDGHLREAPEDDPQ